MEFNLTLSIIENLAFINVVFSVVFLFSQEVRCNQEHYSIDINKYILIYLLHWPICCAIRNKSHV